MNPPLEHQLVEIESQCNEFCVCGVLELVPPRILLKSAPFWHCREVKRLLTSVVFSEKCFFLENAARYIHPGPAPSDRGPRGASGTAPRRAWAVKSPRSTEAKTGRRLGAEGQVRNTGARLTAYGLHRNLHLTHTIQMPKTASAYLE